MANTDIVPSSINLWIEKYKPQQITDLIGCEEEINIITQWLKMYDENRMKFYEETLNKKRTKIREKKDSDPEINEATECDNDNNASEIGIVNVTDSIGNISESEGHIHNNIQGRLLYSSLTLIGNHGSGKTCLIITILKSMGYEIENICMSSIKSGKNITNKINNIMKGTNIFNSLNNRNIIKKAIVIDEIETMTSHVEKKFIEDILKFNNDKWYFPVIFISNLKHSPLMTLLKKNTLNVRINQPTGENIDKLFKKILIGEGIKFQSIKAINKIREHIQFDYRRLLYVLHDLHENYLKNILTEKDIDEYCDTSKTKDTYIEIHKSSAELILKYKNMGDCFRLYSGEKVIIPLMIHQNYPKCITDYQNDVKDETLLLAEISNLFSVGDIIENYIYSEQIWNLQDVHGYYTCIAPAYKLSNINIRTNPENLKKKLDFPYDLNKTSIRKINKKNIINANMCLVGMDIQDLMYAGTLTKK